MAGTGKTTSAAPRVMAAIMGSRVLGLVRELVLNSVIGPGAALDAFYTAFRLPNLLRDLLAEGALSASFTTTFSKKLATDGREEAFALANRMLTSLAVLVTLVAAAGIFFSGPLVAAVGQGFDPEKQALTAELTRILFPFIIFVSLAAVYMGLLNSLGSFGLPASASTAFNATSIVFGLALGWWWDPSFGPDSIYGFAWGTVLGGTTQLFVQMPRARSYGLRLRPLFDWGNPDLVKIYRLALPAILGVAAVQVNVLVNTWWASFLGDGAVTWFNNAFRLMQLPIGVFGVAIGTVVLPEVSRSAAEANMQHFRRKVVDGLKLALFLTVPASIGLALYAEPITGVLFERGRFGPEDTVATAQALQAFTLGLAGYACIKVMAPTFYALDLPRVPVMVSVRAIVLNLVFTTVFLKGFGWGLWALPLSISLVALLNLFQLAFALSRKLGSLTTGTDFPAFFAKMILLCGVLAVVAWLPTAVLGGASGTLGGRLLLLGVGIPLSAGVYFALAWKLGLEEVEQFFGWVRRKAKRGA